MFVDNTPLFLKGNFMIIYKKLFKFYKHFVKLHEKGSSNISHVPFELLKTQESRGGGKIKGYVG